MILRLIGADFSANNIGTIQIIKELTKETKELLSHYTRDISENQKYAVQDFITGLKSEGIWSHIENLYIPALAGDLSETLYDVKGGVVDANPSADAYDIDTHGLHRVDGASASVVAKTKANGSFCNFHMAMFLSRFDVDSKQTRFNTLDDGGSVNFRPSVWNGTSITQNGNGVSNGVSNMGYDLPNSGDARGFYGFGYGTDNNFTVYNGVKKGQSDTPFSTDTTISNFNMYIGTDINGASRSVFSQALISTGSNMGVDMMITYSNLVSTLMASLINYK